MANRKRDGTWAEPHPVKIWAGVVLFFGVGVAIALAVAFHSIDGGGSVPVAMMAGASAGGTGAWLVFYAVLNALKIRERSRPRAGCGRGVAGG